MVMTYPHPSKTYKELVCTAGITESGEWVRLYPIDYRYRPAHQWFRKFQWIEVGLSPRGSGNDKRKESRRPNLDSLRIASDVIPSGKDWHERREIVDRLPVYSVNELRLLYNRDRTSFGVVRPKRILDVKVEKAKERWGPQQEILYHQIPLFGPEQKHLRKIPYEFRLDFECEDSRRPHSHLIADWELGVLFLKEADRLGSDQAAAASVRKKYLTTVLSPKRDVYLFMGTRFPYNVWLIGGIFWPPASKTCQPALFSS